MKNAAKHAEALKSLCRKLTKESPAPERPKLDPLRSIVLAALGEDSTDDRVDAAMSVFDKHFVDLNELRVATELEVADMIGDQVPDIADRTAAIRSPLQGIFEREHALKLDRVNLLKPKEIRQYFRELPGATPYVEASVMLMSYDPPAFPLDSAMLAQLEEEGAIEPGTPIDVAQEFIEKTIKPDEHWAFSQALRARAAGKGRAKAKARK